MRRVGHCHGLRATPKSIEPWVAMAARRFPLALLLAALLTRCASAPPPRPAAPRPLDPCALTAPAQVWLRGGEVLRAPHGPVASDVWNPLVVELLADGRIRARDPSGSPVEGYAPELKGTVAGEERGLGLYVQTETPLFLAPNGAEIGRALPGTYLPVVSMDACFAEVVLRDFSRTSTPGPFRAYLAVDAVGTRELSPRPASRSPRFVRDHRRLLLVEPGQPATAFSETRCGRLEVLETRRDADGVEVQRVAQGEQGVQLWGWVDRPVAEARGEDRCPARVLEKQQVVAFDGEASLPEGFLRLGDASALLKEYEKLTRKERSVFIPLVDGDGVRCEAFKLRLKGTELVRAEQEKGKKPPSWQVRISGGRLTLSGSCRGGGSCAMPYLLAGVSAERIVLLPAKDDLAARAEKLFAYHQDDTEPWFLERSACEARGGVDQASSVLPFAEDL
ncbi:MAG: hypothetical protein HY901_20755 [Deltaproteobacteria bacterium]|nr:hypothetical protein [Deltaproteobacteria bacterium]